MEIGKVALIDIKDLKQIGRQTFYDTFSEGSAEENITKHLNGGATQKLTTELNDENTEFYFAELDNTVIGKAIQFYKKNGFVEFDKHIFKLGNDEQTDIMMKLVLN